MFSFVFNQGLVSLDQRRHMHKYLRIVTSFQRVAHLAKIVSMQKHFKQLVGKQRSKKESVFCISEGELMRFD